MVFFFSKWLSEFTEIEMEGSGILDIQQCCEKHLCHVITISLTEFIGFDEHSYKLKKIFVIIKMKNFEIR